MLSTEAIKYFKDNWYSFKEIEWINLALEQANNWEIISKEEMEIFIKATLFSKYRVNV